MSSSKSHHRKVSSNKILSVTSTADGDIQTVEETAGTGNDDGNDSARTFARHLHDSWDETAEAKGNEDTKEGGNGRRRHKQNLSVQFLDFTISGDDADPGAPAFAVGQSERKDSGKETIEGAIAYYFDQPGDSAAAAAAAPQEGKDTGKDEEDDGSGSDFESFTKNIRNSWDIAEDNGSGGGRTTTESPSGHKPSQSITYLDSSAIFDSLPVNELPLPENSFEYSVDDENAKKDPGSDGEEAADAREEPVATTVDAFEPPAPTPRARLSPAWEELSHESSSLGGQLSPRPAASPPRFSPASRPPPANEAPPQPRLGKFGTSSPISPQSSDSDVVAPIPLRASATLRVSARTVGRKHRRVFSGRSNTAMAHRRVNTKGDKYDQLAEFKFDGPGEGVDEGGGKRAFSRPPQQQPLSPMAESPVPQQRHPQPPPSHPDYGFHPTPPPYEGYGSYDARHHQPPHPPPPYDYGNAPPPRYYDSSPRSDAGASYNTHASPYDPGHPDQRQSHHRRHHHYQQYSPSAQSAPGDYNGNGAGMQRRSSSNSSEARHAHDYAPQHLAQPTLGDEGYEERGPPSGGHQRTGSERVRSYADDLLAARRDSSKHRRESAWYPPSQGQGHRRDFSFNPLPLDDPGAHHRKQSSLGSFLASTSIFEENADLFYEDEGYVSAPEEKRTHNKNLSHESLLRSLSSDNLMNYLIEEEGDCGMSGGDGGGELAKGGRMPSPTPLQQSGQSLPQPGKDSPKANRHSAPPPPGMDSSEAYRYPAPPPPPRTGSSGPYRYPAPPPPEEAGYPPAQPHPPAPPEYSYDTPPQHWQPQPSPRHSPRHSPQHSPRQMHQYSPQHTSHPPPQRSPQQMHHRSPLPSPQPQHHPQHPAQPPLQRSPQQVHRHSPQPSPHYPPQLSPQHHPPHPPHHPSQKVRRQSPPAKPQYHQPPPNMQQTSPRQMARKSPPPLPRGAAPQPGSYMQAAPRGPLPPAQRAMMPQRPLCQVAEPGPKKKGRRKCSVPECPNRVVQGGLCIAHGAKRKTCAYPGCNKNVKKAGMCSAHGPARKRCAVEGCEKVAVQGGRCIAHGAKKRQCSVEGCAKQAILGGMCKKHHDEVHGIVVVRGAKKQQQQQRVAEDEAEMGGGSKGGHGHQRGLSMFQDNDLIEAIVNNGVPQPPTEDDGLHGLSVEKV